MSWFETIRSEPVWLVGVTALVGLMVGSFLNVVIHRLPIMLEREWRRGCRDLLPATDPLPPGGEEPYNLVVPRSRCPGCQHPIRALENVPVLSYLLLRGHCPHCGIRISPRYPVVELLTAVLSALVVWHLGPGIAGAGGVVLTWALIALTFIDLDHQLLPDNITLPCLWLGLGLNLLAVYAPLPAAVIGAMAGYGLLWVVYHLFRLVTGKEGMGYGDFKLTAMLGAWLGWAALPGVVLLSSLVGAVTGILLIALRGRSRAQPIPFGPFLAAAGWIELMWGHALETAYFGLFTS